MYLGVRGLYFVCPLYLEPLNRDLPNLTSFLINWIIGCDVISNNKMHFTSCYDFPMAAKVLKWTFYLLAPLEIFWYSCQLIIRIRQLFHFEFLRDTFFWNSWYQWREKDVIKDSCDMAVWIWKTQIHLCSMKYTLLKSSQRMLTSQPPPKHFPFYFSQP